MANTDQVVNDADMWVDPSDNAISKIFDFIIYMNY